MNQVIKPEKNSETSKKKVTSRSQMTRAKDIQQTPHPPPALALHPRVKLISTHPRNMVKQLSKMLQTVYQSLVLHNADDIDNFWMTEQQRELKTKKSVELENIIKSNLEMEW